MNWEGLSREEASQWAGYLWTLLGAVWVVMRFDIKMTKKRESMLELTLHVIPMLLGFWLAFGKLGNWAWLNSKLLPDVRVVWETGLLLTALGVAISIWARITLGNNWSGAVTLKDGHELIRKGLYRWIRHPIYTGILLGMIGTAAVKGHVRGWLGFLVVLVTFYFKARREESFLRLEFGQGFEEQTRRTGMFLPKLS